MIPVNEPLIGEPEIERVSRCLREGWVSSEGPYVRDFEDQWAAYCGKRFGVAVSSGTAALEVAVGCLELKPDDEVIMPSFTIISCAQAVTRYGGIPVLVDSDPETWCMDVAQVEKKISPRTRAIMPVHMYGHPVDMAPLVTLAGQHGLAIIEDAAEAHGAEYRGQRCGSFGDPSCFSFYANKIVTTGEGGMVLTDSEDWSQRAQSLRNLCFQKERRFFHTALGSNYRLTSMQAAVGLAQLENIDYRIQRKREMGHRYQKSLSGLAGLQLPAEKPWALNVFWMYGVVLDESRQLDASGFGRRLSELGVQTRPFFLGMHEQPVFQAMGLFRNEHYPVAERLARQGLYLPSGMGISNESIDGVCEAVWKALA
jgi:perosamine synthetase